MRIGSDAPVLVVGAGIMGAGIAQVAAQAGHPVWLQDVRPGAAEQARAKLGSTFDALAAKGRMSAQDAAAALGRIRPVEALEQGADAALVVEAIVESLSAKRALFQQLEGLVGAGTVLATNTSSISVTAIANGLKQPGRLVGMHFFNPVPLMKLVEVVRTVATDGTVIQTAMAFASRLGKSPILANDSSGFIVNRLLVPYLLDAIRALEEGIGSIQDIDAGMKLGCNHPMGPLTLLDFVGLDTTYYIANIMFEEFRERRFAPPPLLKRMVQAGYYGKKSGRGFYDWSKEPPSPNNALVGR